MPNKRKLEKHKTSALTKKCSTIIQNKFPLKLKNLESFSIPYTIGDVDFFKVLCGLGNIFH